MTTPDWRLGYPLLNGWYVTDRDPDMRRYYAGGLWSAPVHCDDIGRLGERVRHVAAESQDGIEWRSPAPLPPRPRWGVIGAELMALACKRADGPCDTSPAPLGAIGGAAGGVRTPESLRYDAMEKALLVIEHACEGNAAYEPLGKVARNALNTPA